MVCLFIYATEMSGRMEKTDVQLDMRRRFRGNHLGDAEKTGDRGSTGVVGNVEITPGDR
jgi:hypothetical protein